MEVSLDFSAEEWKRMSTPEQARLCQRLATRARELGRQGRPEHEPSYFRIADEWDRLAAEIVRKG